jgi:hypothetical protein
MVHASALAIIGAVALFGGLMSWAMLVYPGGTWYRHTTEGPLFFRNFVCDLLRNPALNGQPNELGSRLATVSMASLVVGLLLLWLSLPALVPERTHLALASRLLGVVGASGLATVPVLTSERCGSCHTVAVSLAALPSLGAMVINLLVLSLSSRRPLYVTRSGYALLVTGLVTFVWYALDAWRGALVPPVVAALEKIGAILLVIWMLSVAGALWRSVSARNRRRGPRFT